MNQVPLSRQIAAPGSIGESPVFRSELQLDSFNNYGSTDLNVIGFTTQTLFTGLDFTYVTNAANGTVVSIVTGGLYALSASISCASGGSNVFLAISRNATGGELTTSNPVAAITPAHRLALAVAGFISTTLQTPSVSRVVSLQPGDLIRVHGSTSVPVGDCFFSMTKVSN